MNLMTRRKKLQSRCKNDSESAKLETNDKILIFVRTCSFLFNPSFLHTFIIACIYRCTALIMKIKITLQFIQTPLNFHFNHIVLTFLAFAIHWVVIQSNIDFSFSFLHTAWYNAIFSKQFYFFIFHRNWEILLNFV